MTELHAMTDAECVRFQGTLIELAEQDNYIDHSRTIYALDTNVARFIVNPLGHAQAARASFPLTTIFPDDDENVSKLLAVTLARYVTDVLAQQDRPLLLVSPFHAQFFHWFDGITKETNAALNSGIEYRKIDLASFDFESENIDESIKKYIKYLVDLIDSTTNSISRFRELVDSGKLVVVPTATEDELGGDLWEATRPVDPEDKKSWLLSLLDQSAWNSSLGKMAPGRAQDRLLFHKASGLSRIERCSNHMRNPKGGSWHLRFMSFDRLFFDSDVIRSFEGKNEKIAWIRKHVRHPRCLFNKLSVLKPLPSEPSEHFFSWWTGWHVDPENPASKEVVSNIKASWKSFSNISVLNSKLQHLDPNIASDVERTKPLIEFKKGFKERIDAKIEEYWESMIYFATEGRLIFGVDSQRFESPRNGPPLYFSNWKNVRSFVKTVSSWNRPDQFILKSYKKGLQSIRSDAGESTAAQKYAYYVSHAALFAARADWIVAANVARHAQKFTEQPAKGGGTSSGREAFYLEAFCSRHSAQSASDLDGLKEILSKARRLSVAEHGGNGGIIGALMLRFDLEEIALRSSEFFFHYTAGLAERATTIGTTEASLVGALHKASYGVEERDPVKTLVGLYENLKELKIRIKAFELSHQLDSKDNADIMEIVNSISVRCNVNIIVLGIIIAEGFRNYIISDEPFRSSIMFLELLRSANAQKPELRALSPFAKFALSCGQALVASGPRHEGDPRSRLEAAYLGKKGKEVLTRLETFPYDKGEHGRLAKLLEIALMRSPGDIG
jgi:hypothetical protein